MTSQSQIDANRLNAQKSTGPATEEGKAKSRFNALKHGAFAAQIEISAGTAQFMADRLHEYMDHFHPVGVEEVYHVETMVSAQNEQDRLRLLESLAFKQLLGQTSEDSENPIGEAICTDAAGANCLDKLARRREAAHRRWVRSVKMLKDLQAKRLASEKPAAQPAATPPPDPQPRPPQPQPAAEAAKTAPESQPQPLPRSSEPRSPQAPPEIR